MERYIAKPTIENPGINYFVIGGKFIFFFHRGIRKRMFGKVTNFYIWVALRFFEKMAKKLMASERLTEWL